MNQDLALRVLGQIMDWSDDRAREEFDWLRLMGRLKYDGYGDFEAGVRFVESLAAWLQQFTVADREIAYRFVRTSLVYIGPREMERLVEAFYPRTVRDRLHQSVAAAMAIDPFRVLSTPEAERAISRLRRRTLFMGLSDGARIDTIRHENAGVLKNEQFVQGTQVDDDKWRDLLESLRTDLDDENAQFKFVYLIDDFVATGTSFLRFDEAKSKWKGKLIKFRDSINSANERLHVLDPEWELCVHHHLATEAGAGALVKSEAAAREAFTTDGWASEVHLTFGAVLPESLPINSTNEQFIDFLRLTQHYYDPALRTRHTDVGGVTHLGLGYGGCALPIVLDHNTPNNSVALLWAETQGSDEPFAPAMRPLFRRRQRHT
jgi:hypothetical protein